MDGQQRRFDSLEFQRGDDQLLLRREVADGRLSYVGYLNGVEAVIADDRPSAMRALLSAKQAIFQA